MSDELVGLLLHEPEVTNPNRYDLHGMPYPDRCPAQRFRGVMPAGRDMESSVWAVVNSGCFCPFDAYICMGKNRPHHREGALFQKTSTTIDYP